MALAVATTAAVACRAEAVVARISAAGGTARLFMLTDRAMLRDIDQLTDEVKD